MSDVLKKLGLGENLPWLTIVGVLLIPQIIMKPPIQNNVPFVLSQLFMLLVVGLEVAAKGRRDKPDMPLIALLEVFCFIGIAIFWEIWNVKVVLLIIQFVLSGLYFYKGREFELVDVQYSDDITHVGVMIIAFVALIDIVNGFLLSQGLPLHNISILAVSLGYELERMERAEGYTDYMKIIGVILMIAVIFGFNSMRLFTFN